MLIVAGDSRDDDEVVAKSAILGGVVPGMVGPAADLLPEHIVCCTDRALRYQI